MVITDELFFLVYVIFKGLLWKWEFYFLLMYYDFQAGVFYLLGYNVITG